MPRFGDALYLFKIFIATWYARVEFEISVIKTAPLSFFLMIMKLLAQWLERTRAMSRRQASPITHTSVYRQKTHEKKKKRRKRGFEFSIEWIDPRWKQNCRFVEYSMNYRRLVIPKWATRTLAASSCINDQRALRENRLLYTVVRGKLSGWFQLFGL